MSKNSGGCLKSFLIVILVLFVLYCGYSSFSIKLDLESYTRQIKTVEALHKLGGYSPLDLDTLKNEKENLEQEQTVWSIVSVASLCALIVTLIIFKRAPKSKIIEERQAQPDAVQRLEILNKLLKDNFISQDEYDLKKQEIINSL